MAEKETAKESRKRKATKLPEWLSVNKKGQLVIDPDVAYPTILEAMGEKPDQYSVEVAYQIAKMEAQRVVEGTDLDPRPDNTLVILIDSGEDGANKEKWGLANLPKGRNGKTADHATRGGEAVAWYQKLIGKI